MSTPKPPKQLRITLKQEFDFVYHDDPRGFELEIASGVFEDIVMTGVVDRGLIVGPCIWQSQKKLVRV